MSLREKINSDVSSIVSNTWNTRSAIVVPSTDSVQLSGGAAELDASFLYADFANSSRLARDLDRRVTAKILKSFLATTTRLIGATGGKVVSFDGDRVLGIFVGKTKNSSAARCGLQINWVVRNLIRDKFRAKYGSVRGLDYELAHGVGIDNGTVLIVRAGIRKNNDLISIGRAPSLAAKLSDLREGKYHTFITSSVYSKLADASKFGGSSKTNMWERRTLGYLGQKITVYRSSWWWRPK